MAATIILSTPLIRNTDLVSSDDWSFSEGKFTDRSFTNRGSNRRRFFARQIRPQERHQKYYEGHFEPFQLGIQ